VLTAPATFRFTYSSSSERHLRAATLMGVDVGGLSEAQRREALPHALIALMRDIGIPNGVGAVGYGDGDVPALIDGTLKQPRLLAGAPRPIGAQELDWILRDSMRYW
jgi:hydroxyacid-oxoacid transhydrogenase